MFEVLSVHKALKAQIRKFHRKKSVPESLFIKVAGLRLLRNTFQRLLLNYPAAVAQRRSVKKMFLKISQNSQEDACARISFLIKLSSCEFCKIFKNTYFYRTSLVVASGCLYILHVRITYQPLAWNYLFRYLSIF